jgi:hypothetical protein
MRRRARSGQPASTNRSPTWAIQAPTPVVVMTQASLAGAEVYEWVALRRVSAGAVTKAEHRWLANGHQVPAYIAGALARSLATGLVILLDPSAQGVARAVLTASGHDRYEQLLHQALQLPGAEFLALCRRFIDDDPDPVGNTSPC